MPHHGFDKSQCRLQACGMFPVPMRCLRPSPSPSRVLASVSCSYFSVRFVPDETAPVLSWPRLVGTTAPTERYRIRQDHRHIWVILPIFLDYRATNNLLCIN